MNTDQLAPATCLRVDLDIDRCINFAMQQNDVPIVKQMRLTNATDAPLTDIAVTLQCEPDAFPSWSTRVASIPAGGTFTIGPIDLRPSPAFLMALTERIGGRLHVQAESNGNSLHNGTESLELLAFDEWSGLGNSVPEMIAAFVLPNDPIVERVLHDASRWLLEKTNDGTISGYQSRSSTRAGQIAHAIFATLQSRAINYCNPPASFELNGQKIRLPSRIMESKLATCLDLAVLAAACLEQAGLNPLIVIIEGHAFPGLWLGDECFPDCEIDDSARLKKRVDLAEILLFESTLVTSPESTDFKVAVETAQRHLNGANAFKSAIDIARCRKSRIRPLPSHREYSDSNPDHAKDHRPASASESVYQATHAKTLDEAALRKNETPATRLDRWKRKLLDLSLRNKLINFRSSTKKAVALLCPDLTALEDALADGMEFDVRHRPGELDGAHPRNAELHRARTGKDKLDEFLKAELAERRIYADYEADDLNSRLTEVFRTARSAMEEGGASALYLALGSLAWYETTSSEQRRLAPIILIPLDVRRISIQEGFRISQADEEPRVNITLLELLKKDFGVKLPNLDPIPQDDHGVDVAGILNTFRQAIKDIPRWDIVESAYIGFFSFTKFLMWRDLEERSQDLTKSQVVRHLVEKPTEPYPDERPFPKDTELDAAHPPNATFCPMPADSSQLAAVYASEQDRSFVLFGPPGTGKSQTITNLIAHALAMGKSVLFVSEKMAALDVVHKRLSKSGLAPFCLELHSNKSNKRHVTDQLGHALDHRASQSTDDWDLESHRLSQSRSSLNAYVEAMHRPRSFGESVFQATSKLVGLREKQSISLQLGPFDSLSRIQVELWRDAIQRLRAASGASGHPAGHPWSGCSIESWSPGIQRAIESDINTMESLCGQLDDLCRKLGPIFGLGLSWPWAKFEFVSRLLCFLVTSPKPPSPMLIDPDWATVSASVETWAGNGQRRDKLRSQVFAHYADRILQLDLDAISTRHQQALSSWFLPRYFGLRGVRRMLQTASRDTTPVPIERIQEDIQAARQLRDNTRKLAEVEDRAVAILGSRWNQGEADWGEIDAMRQWCDQFRTFALATCNGNSERASDIRAHWAKVLIEKHEALQPDGSIGRLVAAFVDAAARLGTTKVSLETRLGGAIGTAPWGVEAKRLRLEDISTSLAKWKANISGARAWCNWRVMRREAVEAGLRSLVDHFERGEVQADDLRAVFDRSLYEQWVEWATESDEVLRKFFGPEHERQIRQFREIDDRHVQLTRDEIVARVGSRKPATSDRVSDASETGILIRQRKLRRGHMPVRQLFQKIPHLLARLKPCLLMSPISVAQYLDASHPPFDLVVFDEASQIPVWDSVGAIARGREVIVVGDPKQLPPTNFFARVDDNEADDDVNIEEMESILDECLAASLPQLALKWHYRSRHESLITFSNYHYYGNELLTFPSPFVEQGVSYRYIAGAVYDKGKSRTNAKEAEAVVSEVVRRLRNPQCSKYSIGIVTFNIAQQTLIEDHLDAARKQFPEIDPFFTDEVQEPVFIKNLENVQGDERDIVLFSVCYGPDAAGKISMNFGPLNRDGGERRLNVAITRARQEVVVFASLRSDQINLAQTRKQGVQDLKCFLDFADRGSIAISQALSLKGGDDFESPFERDVCARLRERGHTVHSQVGCSGYRIDLAILDPRAEGRYLLGVECDGANYHSAKTARDRDKLREQVLRGLGWKLHRIWSSDWWVNPDECLTKIDAVIEGLMTTNIPESHTEVEVPANAIPVVPEQPDAAPETDAASPPPQQVDGDNQDSSDGAPTYSCFRDTTPKGAPESFYDTISNRLIRNQLERIVEHEGPIQLELASRRLIACWGMHRVGATIRSRIQKIIAESSIRVVQHAGRTFLWPQGVPPDSYDRFRVQGLASDDQRDVDEVPPEEIAAAALFVLNRQVCLTRADLIREIALVFGFGHCGQTIRRVVDYGVQYAVSKGAVAEDSIGRMTVPPNRR